MDLELSSEHALEITSDSAVSEEVAAARGYRTMTGTADDRETLERDGFTPYTIGREGLFPLLYVPMHGRRGEQRGVQIKPADPLVRVTRDGSMRPRKYESPKGAPLCIDVPAFTRETLDREENGQSSETAALWITEGMKKVDALCTQGLAAIGVSGVFNWRQGSGVLGDWEEIPVKDRPMVLCFDADAAGNRLVQQAMKRLGAWLHSRGAASVRYIIVPCKVGEEPVKGVDDFFAAGGTVAQLADVATTTAPGTAAADASFTDAFLVEEAAEQALSGRFCWASGLGWLSWTGRVWKEVPDVDPVEAVRQWAGSRYDGVLAEQAKDKAANLSAKINGWRGVLARAKLQGLVTLSRGIETVQREAADFDGDPDILAVENGVIDLRTGNLNPFDSAESVTKMAGAEYRPGYRHPKWEQALSALPKSVHGFYQDRMGQALTGYPVPDDKLIISYGGGSNGKSTVVNIIKAALGSYGQQISDRVILAANDAHPTELMDLRGVRYAVLEETPEARHLNVTRLKAVVGTESITARRIRQDSVTFSATHSLFINTNFKPVVAESDHGTWRRLALLTFPYTYRLPHEELRGEYDVRGDLSLKYAHQDPDIRAAALAWMVEGAIAWYGRGRQMLPVPVEIEHATRAWRSETDLIIGFADDCLDFDPEHFTPTAQMLQAFNEWSASMGHRPWNDKTFGSRFSQHEIVVGAKVTSGRKSISGKQQRGWFGVRVGGGNSGGSGGSPFPDFPPPAPPAPAPVEPPTAPAPDHFRDSGGAVDGPRIPFDIETGDADALFSAPRGEYVKLVGAGDVLWEAGPTGVETVSGLLTAAPLVGVNNFLFDSIAMERHHGVPVERTIIGGRDLRIAAFQADPPTSYQTKSGSGFKSYSLDALSERYLNRPGKSGLGQALAKEYGGWDRIPADDPRFVQYLREDLAVTEELDRVIPYDPYEEREARVCAATARATLNGFRVDLEGLQGRAQELEQRAEDGKRMLSEEYGFPVLNKQGKPAAAPQRTAAGKQALATALDALGFPVANWPRGKDGELSLYALAHAEAHVPAAVGVIEAVQTMNGIRNNAANVLRHVHDGRVHPRFEPFQATGRWSILDPGLTVLKKGVPDSERYFLMADEGEDLVSIDLDQIDIRCVAAHSQDPALIALLNDPATDFHSEISDMAFGDHGKAHRHAAKSLDLGWLYGRGIRGMVENTDGVTMEAAQRVDHSMRSRFGRVLAWQGEVRERGEAGVLLDNGFGRRLRVDPDRAYTQSPAMIGQSTTRDLIAEGLLTLAATAPEILPMLRVIVHDEVVLSVPRKDREEIARVVQSAMSREWAPAGASRPVSITAGQGKPFVFGERWGQLYES
jgi:P4 family phage/plasmid primase-like protien